MRPPRVLHVLACDNWGGTEVQISTQVLRGDQTTVQQAVAILEPPGVVHSRLSQAGIPVCSLAGRFGQSGAVVRLARLLRRERFDVVEAYGFTSGLVTRAARVLAAGRPSLVMAVRGLHFTEAESPDDLKTRVVLATERILQGGVARYDANSRGARDFLVGRGFHRDKFTVIANGVTTAGVPLAEHGERTGVPLIICVARLVARKRHDVLLRSLAAVRRAGESFRCELIGYGPSLYAMRALCADLGLESEVTFVGRLDQGAITDRLAEADLFVLTSLWEGMPGSVLEAMAAGLPVVGSDVNGTNEVVEDGVTGILVPADDVVATTEALLALLRDPALRQRMGQAGRARIEAAHSFDRVVAEKAALYAELAR